MIRAIKMIKNSKNNFIHKTIVKMRIAHSFFSTAFFSLFILALRCGSDEPVLPKSTADPQILIAHNQYRALVGVAGLEWSEDLAEKARALIKTDSCEWLQNTEGLGQNAARVVFAQGNETTPERIVELWAGTGIKYYIYDLDSCTIPRTGGRGGHECDRYKQIVWANSKTLGCANLRCFPNRKIWVCLYDPPGNIPGERPY